MNKTETKFKFVWLLQPILIAAYPGLDMFAANTEEINLIHLFLLIFITTISTLLIFSALALISRNSLKAIIFTNIIIILFYAIPFFALNFLNSLSMTLYYTRILGLRVFRVRYILAALLLIFSFVFYKTNIKRIKNDILLKIIIVPMLSLLAFSIISNYFKTNKIEIAENSYIKENNIFRNKLLNQIKNVPTGKSLPDIYFILLDSYSSKSYLESIGYDNNSFLNYLRSHNFYVPDESLSNYWETVLSLSCTLNMNYHKDNTIPFSYMWENSNIRFLLEKMGYKYFPIFPFNLQINHKEKLKTKSFSIKKELYDFFFNPLGLFQVYIDSYTPLYIFSPYLHSKPTLSNYKDQIDDLINVINCNSGPKFVYAHFMITHAPYVVNENGNLLIKTGFSRDDDQNAYIRSIKFSNKQIISIVNNILKRNKNSIIIIQGDHGPKYLPYPTDFKNCDINIFRILNAYHLPGSGNNLLYPTISPINNFRIILNHYFGFALPLLQDKSFCGPFENGKFEELKLNIK